MIYKFLNAMYTGYAFKPTNYYPRYLGTFFSFALWFSTMMLGYVILF